MVELTHEVVEGLGLRLPYNKNQVDRNTSADDGQSNACTHTQRIIHKYISWDIEHCHLGAVPTLPLRGYTMQKNQ